MHDPATRRVAGKVATAILWLASDESSFVTGTNLVFDDGDAA